MTTAMQRPRAGADRAGLDNPLVVSTYDRTASLLVSLIILIGSLVLLMFVIWLTRVVMFREPSVPVTWVEEYAGRGDHAQGYERDLEEPGHEELEELLEPQLEQTLEAVTDVVTSQLATLELLETDALLTSSGTQMGDSRREGPLGEGDDIIPPWDRWRIQYTTTSLDAYARQLDHFGIELAAVGGGTDTVDYVAQMSRPAPQHRQARGGADEQRIYFNWTSGELRALDEQLLARAGVRTQGRLLLQFIPPEVENRLRQLEQQYAQSRGIHSLQQIERTVFGVRGSGGGYEFFVVQQAHR